MKSSICDFGSLVGIDSRGEYRRVRRLCENAGRDASRMTFVAVISGGGGRVAKYRQVEASDMRKEEILKVPIVKFSARGSEKSG